MQEFFLLLPLRRGDCCGDQITKALVVAHIPPRGHMIFLPGFSGLYLSAQHRRGVLLFEGMQWLFALIFLAFTAALL